MFASFVEYPARTSPRLGAAGPDAVKSPRQVAREVHGSLSVCPVRKSPTKAYGMVAAMKSVAGGKALVPLAELPARKSLIAFEMAVTTLLPRQWAAVEVQQNCFLAERDPGRRAEMEERGDKSDLVVAFLGENFQSPGELIRTVRAAEAEA